MKDLDTAGDTIGLSVTTTGTFSGLYGTLVLNANGSYSYVADQAAADALGVVATLPFLAAPELAAGRLILPFELQVPLKSAYYVVSTEAGAARPEVAAFRAWMLEEAARSCLSSSCSKSACLSISMGSRTHTEISLEKCSMTELGFS